MDICDNHQTGHPSTPWVDVDGGTDFGKMTNQNSRFICYIQP